MALFSRYVGNDDSPRAAQQTISSPAFSSLWKQLNDDRKYRILDMGSASGASVAFYSALRCKLFVDELIPAVRSYQASLTDDGVHPTLRMQDLLGMDDLFGLDLVMCWDTLNYLDKQLIEPVLSSLHRLMADGGCLHAFVYTRRDMPAGPGIYQIVDADRMLVEYPSGARIPAPAYSQRELENLMQGFNIRQSRLLQSGMQEYVFCKQ
jgi:hypothetical protein